MKATFVQIFIAIGDATMDLESAGEMLLAAGAESAEVVDEVQVRLICLETEVSQVVTAARALGLMPSLPSPIKEADWCPIAPELLEPLSIGGLLITPVLSTDTIPHPDPASIFIVPGTGFGTGHHATTASIIGLLTQLRDGVFGNAQPRHIADIGTGSGILAFAAAKLFPEASVIATDIDPLALDNAVGNRSLNSLDTQIDFLLGDIPSIEQSGFDLILANIYGEVLVSLAEKFNRIASDNTFLLTSGIALNVEAAVRDAYKEWTLVRRLEKDNWVTLLFRR